MENFSATGERSSARPGLSDSVRSALGAAASYLQARLQLAGMEAKEAAGHYLKLIIFGVTALVALAAGYLFLMIGLVFVIAHATGWAFEWVLLGLAGAHILTALVCALLAWQFLGKSIFDDSLAELKKDQEWLTSRPNNL